MLHHIILEHIILHSSVSCTYSELYITWPCMYADVWSHGDFCQISSATGGIFMLGRRSVSLSRAGLHIGFSCYTITCPSSKIIVLLLEDMV